MQKEAKKRVTEKMDKTIESLKHDLGSIRTGRASLAIFDGLMVDYFGTPTPLTHVATLSVPESRLITIQPWDPKIISEIERAIQKSELGLNPGNDGKIIRVAIPTLTEERRKELVKVVHKRGEEAKISLRSIRRDGNDEMKQIEKEEHLSEDETKRAAEEIQKLTDSYIKKVDETVAHKEEEVMEV
jgi:ribosome recycling factor